MCFIVVAMDTITDGVSRCPGTLRPGVLPPTVAPLLLGASLEGLRGHWLPFGGRCKGGLLAAQNLGVVCVCRVSCPGPMALVVGRVGGVAGRLPWALVAWTVLALGPQHRAPASVLGWDALCQNLLFNNSPQPELARLVLFEEVFRMLKGAPLVWMLTSFPRAGLASPLQAARPAEASAEAEGSSSPPATPCFTFIAGKGRSDHDGGQ